MADVNHATTDALPSAGKSIFRSLPGMVIASLMAGLAIGAAIRPLSADGGMKVAIDVFDVVGCCCPLKA